MQKEINGKKPDTGEPKLDTLSTLIKALRSCILNRCQIYNGYVFFYSLKKLDLIDGLSSLHDNSDAFTTDNIIES